MKMEVKIVSKELIKPSSPTPHHLRDLHCSFLDQVQPHIWIPFIFFYSNKSSINNINNIEICNLLKKSLSDVLTTFYPVAGRVKNNSYIDCNDEGVLFVEAKVNCQLSNILRDRIPSNNNNFIPPRLDEYKDLVAFSQVSFLSCGGIVVSFAVTHKIGDALSWITFFNSWAATARGNAETIKIPHFGSASFFPPMDMSRFGSNGGEFNKEKLVTKVFVFDSLATASLKDKYRVNTGKRISDVLAVGGFICSRFMVTSVEKNKNYKVIQAVNLRTRMNPPLPMLSFGNYAIAVPLVEGSVNDEDDEYWYKAVKKMADSTINLNANQIAKLRNEDGQLNFLRKIYPDLFGKEDVVSFTFSSIKGFPLYDVDFGWGKPLWVATIPFGGKNIIFLVPTFDGLGLEAWVCLKEEDMAKFEIDNKLVQHVSPHTVILEAHSRL